MMNRHSLPPSATAQGKRRTDWLIGGFILVVMGLILLAGCGKGGDSGGDHAGHAGMDTDDERYETTASYKALPSFLADYTDHTSELYAAVGAHEDILRQLNCYCGCMTASRPHDSLYRCYVASKNEDGIEWTDHSANCGICKMELEEVIKLAKEGKSADEIRAAVDAKFKPAGL